MLEKIVDYGDLNDSNSFFVPQAGFAYSNLGEKNLATFFIFSCVGVYLKQNNVQVLAHIDSNPCKNLNKMLNYLFQKKVIKNEPFDKAYVISGFVSYKKNIESSLDYIKKFCENAEVIHSLNTPLHFLIDNSGEFKIVNNIIEKKYSESEVFQIFVNRLSRTSMICKNEKKEI